jgi:hypothetical protein
MALRQTKKISELTALTSASLQTTLVGVDNGTTYKITLDVLEDAVINMVSRSTDLRLDALESYTASANAASDITYLNSFTSSQTTLNSAFTSGINGRLQTSSFNDFSSSIHSEIVAATNEQSFNGLISGSSQLTSSYDNRYVLSGSLTQTTWDNISGKPSGLVSQSTDLSYLNSFTASYFTDSASIDSRLDGLETFSSSLGNTFATDLEVSIVSSSVAATIGVISQNTGLVNTSSFNSYTASISTASLVTSITQLNTYTASQSTASLVSRLNAIENVSSSWITETETSSFLTSLNGAISSSSQLTSSYDARYTLSGSISSTPAGTISSSAQITTLGFATTSSFNSYTASISTASLVTSITQLNTYTASVSTASIVTSITNLNTYTASQSTASLVTSITQLNTTTASLQSQLATIGTQSGSWGSGGSVPAGTISGSSQLTSSFDGRYTQTGSFNTLTASFNSFTASAQSVTTGSNSFNGTQTITGSLIITTGSFIGSQILANTSSLYLTSGSNLYVQNNGLVEITGSIIATSITGSIAATNGVISSSAQISASGFVSSSNVSTIQTITSASYAAITPVSGTLYIIIG